MKLAMHYVEEQHFRGIFLTFLGYLILIAAAGALGCTSESTVANQKRVYPVRGKVTVQGKPAKGAFVLLVPVNEPPEAPDPRPRGEAGEDGSFALSTYGENDGAPAGEYVVTLNWPGGVLPDGREEPADKLHGRYSGAGKSKLRATVKEGSNELPALQLP